MSASLHDRATAVEPVPVSPLRDGIPSAELDEIHVWLTENCGRGLPHGPKTDLAGALHGLSYVLRQIEGTNSYKVHIGQCESAATAIRWTLYHFAAQAIEARRAETQGGSVHESAVGEADAPGA